MSALLHVWYQTVTQYLHTPDQNISILEIMEILNIEYDANITKIEKLGQISQHFKTIHWLVI